jgi:hypothetical protein
MGRPEDIRLDDYTAAVQHFLKKVSAVKGGITVSKLERLVDADVDKHQRLFIDDFCEDLKDFNKKEEKVEYLEFEGTYPSAGKFGYNKECHLKFELKKGKGQAIVGGKIINLEFIKSFEVPPKTKYQISSADGLISLEMTSSPPWHAKQFEEFWC